jgi:TetR/AcrR family transcriptional repressor of nem operon
MRSAEQTKNLIISKAMAIFNTKGYMSTSLSDITKETGLTKGAIYGNFENKDALAIASFEYAVNKVMAQVRTHIKAADNAPDKLRAMAKYYEDYILNPPISGGCPIINTSIEADDNHPNLRMKVIRTLGIMKDSIKKIIHRGIKEKQIKPETNVDEFAMLFYASIEGAIILSRVEGDTESYKLVLSAIDKQIEEITF